jgi:hydrogenase nickel incorporation protein HypA/HybF
VHERALMRDVVAKIEAVASEAGAERVTRVAVRLGSLSHFTPAHFREHFADASRGTVAEGATIEAVLDGDAASPSAQDVLLESVEVETGARTEVA